MQKGSGPKGVSERVPGLMASGSSRERTRAGPGAVGVPLRVAKPPGIRWRGTSNCHADAPRRVGGKASRVSPMADSR